MFERFVYIAFLYFGVEKRIIKFGDTNTYESSFYLVCKYNIGDVDEILKPRHGGSKRRQ